MAGTGGKEVGKVSIRVVPDLDEFRNKLRAELEKWERDPRQIKVKADVSDFRSDIENAARGLTAEVDVDAQTGGLRREIERATDGVSSTVDVNARVKSGELAKSLRDQISELNSRVINLYAKPELDPGDIAKLKADIQRVRDLKAKIGVDVDAAKAINDLQDAARGLTLSSSEPIEFDDLDVNPDKAVKKTKDAFKGFKVKFPVEPESEGLDRFQRRLLAQVQSAAAKLDAKIPLDAEGEGFRREVNDLVKAAVAKVTAKIPVELSDAADVRLEAAQLVNEIQSLADDGDVRVAVSPDLDRFQKRYLSKIQSFLAEAEANLPLTVDGENLRRQITKEAAILESRVKAINVDADPIKDLVRALNSIDVENRIQLDDRDFQASIVRARAEADKVLAGLEAQVGVEPSIDNGKLSSAVAKLRAALSGFSVDVDTDIGSVQVSADTDRLRSEVAAAVRDFTAVVDVDADAQGIVDLRREVEAFYQKIRTLSRDNQLLDITSVAVAKREIERLSEFERLRIKLETDDLYAKYFAWEAFVANQNVEVKLRPKYDLQDIRKSGAALRQILKGQAEVVIDVDASAGTRALSRVVQGFGLVTSSIGSARKQLLSFVDTFAGLAVRSFARLGPQIIAIAGLIAALLPPVLALGAGLITLAPAALAGLAPIAAIALGVEGIKRAAEVAKPAFDALRKAVADVFEFGLPGQQSMTAGFKALAENVIPNVKNSLQNVAQGLNNQFNAVVGVLSSPKGLANLNNIFNNVAVGLDNAKAGLKGFTSGLLELISAISNKFPGLGTWFSELGEKFAGWVEKFTTIKDSNGLTGLERTIQNVRIGIEGLTGVFQAFFSQGLKDIQDPNFGQGMRNFFDSVKSFVTNTLPTLSEGFKTIANLLKQMEPLFKLVGLANNLAQLTVNPGQAVSDAVSRFKKGGLKEALLGVGRGDDNPFQNLPNQASQAASESKKALQDGLVLKGSFGGIGDVAANASSQAVDNVKSQVSSQVQAAITEAQTALQALGPTLQTSIDEAVEPLNGLPAKIGQTFGLLGAAVGGAWDAVTNIIAERTAGISTAIVTAFEGIPTRLLGSFAALGASVGGAMSALRGVISSSLGGITDAFGQAFAGAAGRVSSALTGVTAAVSQAMAASAQAAATGVTGILQVLQAGLAAAPQVVQAIFGSIPAVVQGAMAPAITAVSTICQQMVSTALAFAGAMQSAGQSIGASFAAGIASSEGLVRGAASALLDAARGFFPSSPAKEGPFSGSGWVDKSGVAVGEAFAGGIQDSVGGVVNIAKVLMQQVKDVFGNAEGVVFNFNFGGVNSGLERTASSLGAVQNQLGSFSSSAQEFQSSFGQGVLPQLSGPESKQQLRDLSQQLAELEIVRKSLELQKVPGADNSLVKAQLEQIRLRKLELGLQKNQLEYSNKYGASQNSITDAYGQQIKDLASMPMDFGRAVGDQFMSDLGFGNGALPTVANELLNWGSQIVFNVGNMDDALQGQRRLQSQQAAGMIGR